MPRYINNTIFVLSLSTAQFLNSYLAQFPFIEVEKNLSAARRKDLQEEINPARKVRPESAGEAPKPTPRSLPPRTQSAHTLMSNGWYL